MSNPIGALAKTTAAVPFGRVARRGATHNSSVVTDGPYDLLRPDDPLSSDLRLFDVKPFEANATVTVRYKLDQTDRIYLPVTDEEFDDFTVPDPEQWMSQLIKALGVNETQYKRSLLSILHHDGLVEMRSRATDETISHAVHQDRVEEDQPLPPVVMFIERCGADEEVMLPTHAITMEDVAVPCNETKAIVTFHNNLAAGHRASSLRNYYPRIDNDLTKPGRRSFFYRYMFTFDGFRNEMEWHAAFESGDLASLGIETFFNEHIAIAYARAARPITEARATEIFDQLILQNLDRETGRVAPILFALMSALDKIEPPGAYDDLVREGFVHLWLAGLAAGRWNPNELLPLGYKLPEKYREGAEQEFKRLVKELNTKDRCSEVREVALSKGITVLQDDSIQLYPENELYGHTERIVAYYDAVTDTMVAKRPEGIVLVTVAVVTSEMIYPSYAERAGHWFRAAGTGREMPRTYKTAFSDLCRRHCRAL